MKEGGNSARDAGPMWGLSMKKSTLQVSLNRRVTFYRRLEGPSLVFFLTKNENNNKKRFTDWVIELANCGFGLSTDAFLKSVKKFLDKGVRTISLACLEIRSRNEEAINSKRIRINSLKAFYSLLLDIYCLFVSELI